MARVSLNVNPRIKDKRKILYERYGGYMTLADIMSELGVCRGTAMKFAAKLPSISPTGKKIYDVFDVAKQLESTYCPPKVM